METFQIRKCKFRERTGSIKTITQETRSGEINALMPKRSESRHQVISSFAQKKVEK